MIDTTRKGATKTTEYTYGKHRDTEIDIADLDFTGQSNMLKAQSMLIQDPSDTKEEQKSEHPKSIKAT